MLNFMKKPDPRQLLDAMPVQMQNIYLSTESLRQLVTELQTPLLNLALNGVPNGPHNWQPGNYRPNILPNVHSALPAAIAALNFLEGTDEYQEARRVIEPLLAVKVELESAEEAARQTKQQKVNALNLAQAAAFAAARVKAANDPAVLKAEQELAAMNG